jgi:hypothetical protein
LRSRTHFRRYGGCWVQFSCDARPDSFSAIPTTSAPVFMFCAPGLVFGCTDGVGSRFHFLRTRTRFRRCRGRRSRFHVLRSRDHFRRFRGRRVPFSCFASPYSFSTVPMASGPIFMCGVPRLVFGGAKGVWSRILVLSSQTRFRHYRGHRLLFSCFALADSFSATLRASGPVFMCCAPGLIFDGTDGVGSRFDVLRSRTCFQRYRGRRVMFSCFALQDSFSTVPRASSPVFMFCAPELIFDGTDGVRSSFYV